MANIKETDLGMIRMYQDGSDHVTFSPPVKALKWSLIFGAADNKYSRQAFALMLTAECEGRMADHE